VRGPLVKEIGAVAALMSGGVNRQPSAIDGISGTL